MTNRVKPEDHVSGISIPPIAVESTLGDNKRAIFADGKHIIGYMTKDELGVNKWSITSLDGKIKVNAYVRSQALLMLWMALEIRKLNRQIDVLQSPRTDLGSYL